MLVGAEGQILGSAGNATIERRDPTAHAEMLALTQAAAKLGDWRLAVAAYNAGEGRILRGLQRTGATSFWELRDANALHRETKDYVPFFLAAALIAPNPARCLRPVATCSSKKVPAPRRHQERKALPCTCPS